MSRAAFETPLASGLRKTITLREARSEVRFINQQAEVFGVKAFHPDAFSSSLEPKHTADTLFVLGSGSSIKDLTAANFEEIHSQRSVGINNWGMHWFVPDFYALESVPWVGDGEDFSRALQLLDRKDIFDARPSIMVLRPSSGRKLPGLESLPSAFSGRVFFYGRVSPATRRAANLRKDFARVLGSVVFQHKGVFLDSGASVVRMIGVALSLGLSRVVLTGVDLNDTSYFWEENLDYDLNKIAEPPVNNQKGFWNGKSTPAVHETMMSENRAFPVAQMLSELSPVLLEQFELKLFVSSQKSMLSEFLPVFAW